MACSVSRRTKPALDFATAAIAEVTGEDVNPLPGQANEEACAQGEAHAAAPVPTSNGKSRRASLVIAETHELLHGLGEDAARSKALMEELEKLLAGSRSCASSSGRSEHGGAGAGAEGDGPAKPHCNVVEAQNFKSVEPIQIDSDDDSDTDEHHPFSPQPPRTPATPSGRRHSVTFEAPSARSEGRRSSVVMLDGTALMPVGGSSLRPSSTNTPFVVALGAAPAPPAGLRSSVSFTNRRASSLVATTAQAAHILGGRSYNDLRSSRRRSSTDAPGPLPHLLAALPALSGTSSGPGYAHSNASSRRATGQGDAADSPGASPAAPGPAPGPSTGVSAMRSRSFRNNLLLSCSLQPPSYSSGQLSIAESRSMLDGDAPPAPHLHSHPPPAGLYPAMHLDEAEEDAEAEAEAEAEAQAAACRGATADGGYAHSPSGLQRSSSSKRTGRFMKMLKGIFVPATSASQPSSGEAGRRAEPLARASTLDAAGLAERSQPSAGALSSMAPLARHPSMRRPTTTSHGQLQGPLPGGSPRSFTAARSTTACGGAAGGILGSEQRMEQVMRAAAAVAGMGHVGVRAGSLSAAQVPQVAAAVASFTSAARGPMPPSSSTQHGWVGEAYASNGGLSRSTSRRASSTFSQVGALPHL
ncbi:hypothetical protein HYH03_000687 [Edaphochlamys debaryana]|uniref:Uncharacterized protein n=1 Tax=Edaphochlamys debaryana TaxID=47281 RepID=A0A835YGM8_9CHLO|nr:hypothetical protein HYH03_000687 [Edaphochlamys debaryana]|eukprot:KAG2502201.1 hypothetical protein HYH03_000687 [Edaphochlamys debaryana]